MQVVLKVLVCHLSIPNCTMSIFADDTGILFSGTLFVEIVSNLQTALDKLFDYFSKWKIALKKKKGMLYTSK